MITRLFPKSFLTLLNVLESKDTCVFVIMAVDCAPKSNDGDARTRRALVELVKIVGRKAYIANPSGRECGLISVSTMKAGDSK